MEKIKLYLLYIIAFTGILATILFIVVEPVYNGINKYGLPGFIGKVVGFIFLICIIAGLSQYNKK